MVFLSPFFIVSVFVHYVLFIIFPFTQSQTVCFFVPPLPFLLSPCLNLSVFFLIESPSVFLMMSQQPTGYSGLSTVGCRHSVLDLSPVLQNTKCLLQKLKCLKMRLISPEHHVFVPGSVALWLFYPFRPHLARLFQPFDDWSIQSCLI